MRKCKALAVWSQVPGCSRGTVTVTNLHTHTRHMVAAAMCSGFVAVIGALKARKRMHEAPAAGHKCWGGPPLPGYVIFLRPKSFSFFFLRPKNVSGWNFKIVREFCFIRASNMFTSICVVFLCVVHKQTFPTQFYLHGLMVELPLIYTPPLKCPLFHNLRFGQPFFDAGVCFF